jgi:iron complex transport system permease protein
VIARLARLWEDQRERPATWNALLAAALLAASAGSIAWGSVGIPLQQLPAALLDPGHPAHPILWNVRLPRLLVAILVGSALALSGALLQTVVRNPLADPGLLGVTQGAGVGALLGILLAPTLSRWLPLFAFGGALVGLAFVLLIARAATARASSLRLILSGVGLQAMLFSAIAVLTFLFADRAPAYVAFTVGSLSGAGWREVSIAALPTAVGLGVALAAMRPLDVLLLDDDTAGGVGLAVARARVWVSCLSAWLAATAVSVAGLIGFVGLVVPNAVRLAAGPEHRALLPASLLGGAALVAAADLIARTATAPLELPAGALLALVGGPSLIYLLWKQLP